MERSIRFYQLESKKKNEQFTSNFYQRIGHLMMRAAMRHRQAAEQARKKQEMLEKASA